MQRRDRRLQRERAGPAAQRLLHQRQRLGDLPLVPAAAILLFENDDIAGVVEPRIAPRIVKQHQREQRGRFRRRCGASQRCCTQPSQPDGLGAQIGPTSGPPRVAA